MKISKKSVCECDGVMLAEASCLGLKAGQWPYIVEVDGVVGAYKKDKMDRLPEGELAGVWYRNPASSVKLLIEND